MVGLVSSVVLKPRYALLKSLYKYLSLKYFSTISLCSGELDPTSAPLSKAINSELSFIPEQVPSDSLDKPKLNPLIYRLLSSETTIIELKLNIFNL